MLGISKYFWKFLGAHFQQASLQTGSSKNELILSFRIGHFYSETHSKDELFLEEKKSMFTQVMGWTILTASLNKQM